MPPEEATTTTPTSPTSSEPTAQTSLLDPKSPPSTPDKTTEEKFFEKPPEEKKPEEEKKAEEKPTESDALTLDKLTVPEGLDPKNPLVEEFVGSLNDKDLSPIDRANKMLDLYKKSMTEYEEASTKHWLETNEKWQQDLITEFGEAKLEERLAKAGSVLESFDKDMRAAFASANADKPAPEFGKELRQALTLTGAGNHPAIVKFLFWAADQLGEGAPLSGTPAGGAPLSREDRMYGST